MESCCGRTTWSTTRCKYYTAHCRHQPINKRVLQHVVVYSQWNSYLLTTCRNHTATCCYVSGRGWLW